MKVLITGGTNGMGKGVAKILAGVDNQIHEVIILCRSKALGEATIKEIESTTNNKKISIVICDLTKLSGVRNAIKEIQSQHKFLDGIFINAGLGYAAKRVETEDGKKVVFNQEMQDRLWKVSLELTKDENTIQIAEKIYNYSK